MNLYQEWNTLVEEKQTARDGKEFWKSYFEGEKESYAAILADQRWVLEGMAGDLAKEFQMDPVWFAGFLDGINSSLTEPLSLGELSEESPIHLTIEPEKLYLNMLHAKADWLYNLPQWDDILTAEQRREINQEYRSMMMAKSTKVGRNEPCPCGSGKKYKKCCGA